MKGSLFFLVIFYFIYFICFFMNVIARNRKIEHFYKIYHRMIAGISLIGNDPVLIRNRKFSIENSYINFKEGELYVFNLIISNSDVKKFRKLLLKKREISWLISEIRLKKISILPTMIFTKGRWIKMEICIVKRLKKNQMRKEDKLRKELKKEDKASFSIYDN